MRTAASRETQYESTRTEVLSGMSYVNYAKRTTWTREKVLHALSTDPKWVEIAIVRLFDRNQIPTEQALKTTHVHNDIGFQQMDARFFSICALTIKKRARNGVPCGQRLEQWQLAKAMKPWGKQGIPRIAKYRRQILQMIEDAAA